VNALLTVMTKRPNKAIHFNDGVTVLALERKDGTVMPCYLDTKNYDLVKRYRWHVQKVRGMFYADTTLPRVNGKVPHLTMHKLVLPLSDGSTPDHFDQNGLNNRKSNLRPASTSQQNTNRKKPVNNTSGYKGVSLNAKSGKYHATIQTGGKRKWVGQFASATEAAIARDAVAKELQGKFAVLNFPQKATA
jgi:hypothetical protein